MMRISSLSADTIDYILTSLTDFKSLASVLLASKSVYGVYSTRPTSIKRAVAYNVVGPALPQALRLVRCDRQEMKQLPAGELPGEDELEKNPCLSSDDIRGLVKISEQAQELEDIFSWRCVSLLYFIICMVNTSSPERKITLSERVAFLL